jgi:hypothetical protein
MSRRFRARLAWLGVLVMALSLNPAALAPAYSATTSSVAGSGVDHPELRTVSYRGIQVEVPSTWPVHDLTSAPDTCVRLDRNAVYLGAPGADQDCPARAIGRSDTVWLRPASPQARSLPRSSAKVGGLDAVVRSDAGGHVKHVSFTGRGVEAEVSWAADPTVVDRVLSSASPTSTAPSAQPSTSDRASAEGTSRDLARTASLSTATAPAQSTAGGMGFDTCAAPSTAVMDDWLSSPYRSVGIYLGGSMRACPDGNLSAAWVDQVKGMGWGLMPLWVGPQAPCVIQDNLAHIDPAQAAAQGKANAADAVTRAQYFGLGAGTPIYYNMEGYARGDAACTATVLTFVTAWTNELHRLGYGSGVYGGSGSLMVDMSNAVGSSGFAPPDDVWFAHWNGLQTTSDSASYPDFRDGYWSRHQRLHQYNTLTQSWGGSTINIDANWLDGAVAGRAVPVSYGTRTYGPGSTSFVFTGKMDYWRKNDPYGRRAMSYWTHPSSDGTEYNGATWSPRLSRGLYRVSASIPKTNATAQAHYTVTDAQGVTDKVVDQGAVTSDGVERYTSLGTYLARSGSSVTVHVADDGPGPTTDRIGVDAMRFELVATVPGAPTSVSAVAGNARATVSWSAAPSNGSAITGYTVTASPGGATARVSGSARSAVVSGLTNDTTYTFTVRATNVVGTGPASQPSNAARPSAWGLFHVVEPARVLDTRSGETANPRRTALGAGESVRVKVAGVSGSPVPAGATAAALNVTVTGPRANGLLYVGAGSDGRSTLNFATGQTLAHLGITRVRSDGTVTIVNHSRGAVHVLVDATGYLR